MLTQKLVIFPILNFLTLPYFRTMVLEVINLGLDGQFVVKSDSQVPNRILSLDLPASQEERVIPGNSVFGENEIDCFLWTEFQAKGVTPFG